VNVQPHLTGKFLHLPSCVSPRKVPTTFLMSLEAASWGTGSDIPSKHSGSATIWKKAGTMLGGECECECERDCVENSNYAGR